MIIDEDCVEHLREIEHLREMARLKFETYEFTHQRSTLLLRRLELMNEIAKLRGEFPRAEWQETLDEFRESIAYGRTLTAEAEALLNRANGGTEH